ncbi:uncharacterized protein LOC128229652 [Mya arenaria]|uniref:uncharacterized protein LOC128229652 n=1 Tax=Mya arenaria TaxID=6604 RepID=UPI0022E08604|nr:uncharacterized protein LOC128229652 [Mya arenaria]
MLNIISTIVLACCFFQMQGSSSLRHSELSDGLKDQHENIVPRGRTLRSLPELAGVQNIADFTFSGLPNLVKPHDTIDSIPSEYINITRKRLYGRNRCRRVTTGVLDTGETRRIQSNSMRELALCPWRYVVNEDENRVPRQIAEVQCTCRRPGLSDAVCFPVTMYTRVNRRVWHENGDFRYRSVLEPLSVACVATVLSGRAADQGTVRLGQR